MGDLKRYGIKDLNLLKQVLTHKSWRDDPNNERLEFLGDAVLGLIIADLLMKKHPQAEEGELTKKRSRLICTQSLAGLAIEMGFPEDLIAESSDYKNNPRILAGVLEAYIGAVYLENSFSQTKEKVEILFQNLINREIKEDDPKIILQEWCQKTYKDIPLYKLKKTEGLEHEKTFFVDVLVQGKFCGTGSSQTKKQAEREAAKKALETLKIPFT